MTPQRFVEALECVHWTPTQIAEVLGCDISLRPGQTKEKKFLWRWELGLSPWQKRTRPGACLVLAEKSALRTHDTAPFRRSWHPHVLISSP